MSTLRVGDVFESQFVITQDDVARFVALSGDSNVIHTSVAAAERSPIGVLAVPGMVSAAKISGIHGTQFPGHGTVYAETAERFRRPMFVGSRYVVLVEVVAIDAAKHRATLQTTVREAESSVVTLLSRCEVVHFDLL